MSVTARPFICLSPLGQIIIINLFTHFPHQTIVQFKIFFLLFWRDLDGTKSAEKVGGRQSEENWSVRPSLGCRNLFGQKMCVGLAPKDLPFPAKWPQNFLLSPPIDGGG